MNSLNGNQYLEAPNRKFNDKRAPRKRIFLGGEPLTWLINNLTFLGFLGGLALLYIANSHAAMSRVRNISKLQEELKQVRWEAYSQKAELMYLAKYTEIAKLTKDKGLVPSDQKPKVLLIKK